VVPFINILGHLFVGVNAFLHRLLIILILIFTMCQMFAIMKHRDGQFFMSERNEQIIHKLSLVYFDEIMPHR
jgi:hypothetical protein